MRCKFCFATFQDVKHSILPTGHLPKKDSIEVVKQLARVGFQKITFAGGEPTLCPWLSDLIKTAKDSGMTTMIVSNGSKITDEFLIKNRNQLDWIAISIDSLNPETNIKMGRAIAGNKSLSCDYYISLIDRIKAHGYGLKINTVVCSKNYTEDLNTFISYAKPKRWKILQVLPMEGQNDLNINELKINDDQFQGFLNNHNKLNDVTNIVPETNSQMKGSYAMVDPAGRFFDNATGKHNYSRPILEIGPYLAIQQVNYDIQKFESRGGWYDWKKANQIPSRITLSGEVASGKSSVGKLLADRLSYSFTSIGNKTRIYAESRGLGIAEFQRECLINPELDKQIDTEFAIECNSKENLVIDYRLGFKFIEKGFHVLLRISEDSALERLKLANRDNETYHTLRERNNNFFTQFKNAYGIDYLDTKYYDLIIDVENFTTPELIVEAIINKLK